MSNLCRFFLFSFESGAITLADGSMFQYGSFHAREEDEGKINEREFCHFKSSYTKPVELRLEGEVFNLFCFCFENFVNLSAALTSSK